MSSKGSLFMSLLYIYMRLLRSAIARKFSYRVPNKRRTNVYMEKCQERKTDNRHTQGTVCVCPIPQFMTHSCLLGSNYENIFEKYALSSQLNHPRGDCLFSFFNFCGLVTCKILNFTYEMSFLSSLLT